MQKVEIKEELIKKGKKVPTWIIQGGENMAKVIENEGGRRLIRVSTDDVISLVREYQTLTRNVRDYERVREILNESCFYLPEEC